MQTNRISSIDQFRGFAILLMVLANYAGTVKVIPAWLKHTPDIGLTVIDLIAPLFVFAIGLTYGLSFRRRAERNGAFRTYVHFLTRFLAILGLGAVMSALETAYGVNPGKPEWGVLQAIGMAGLVTLIVIRLPALVRGIISLALLAIYQVLLEHFFLALILRSPHGGLFGSIAWAAMLILATALANTFHDTVRWRKFYPWLATLVLVAGVALAFLSPISKSRVSAAYVLVSLGTSAFTFALFHWLSERFRMNSRLLAAWGKNPLTLYMLHYILIGIVFLPGIPVLFTEAPLWLAILEMTGLVASLTAIAFWMERKNLIISL